MNSVVEQILDSPRLPEIVDQLQARLIEERRRREKFYQEMTEGQKAEFINGEVFIHSPARNRHLAVRENLHILLEMHVRVRNSGIVRGEKALCVFPRNDYEPDVCFFGVDKTKTIQPVTLKFPMPDFIAEVLSDTTEQLDRGQKYHDYEAHGVGEYWIIDPEHETVEQFLLERGTYQLTQKSGSGEVASRIVTGFCIPVRALFDPDLHLGTLRGIVA